MLGKAFVGSICFDGNSIEASVHWLDRSLSSQERQYDVFSMRVATGHPFAATLAGYRSSHHEFANFLDWMSSTRDLRWTQITECPTKEPAAMTFEEREGCLPTKSDGEEEDEDDEEEEEEEDDDDRGNEADEGDYSYDASENENENKDKRDGPGAQAGSAGQATTSNRQRTEELGAERRLDLPGAVLNTIWAAIKTLKRKRQ